MNRLKGYVQLTRPVNLLIAFLSIGMGGLVAGSIAFYGKLLLAALSGTCIAAGANGINDVFDLEIDRINKPKRPLPAGTVSVSGARLFSLALLTGGAIMGAFIMWQGFVIASGSALLLYLYSWKLKQTVLMGNLTVSFITGLAFVYGGIAVGKPRLALIVGVFAFFFHLGREIIKDAADVEGDRMHGAVTLPIRYGLRVALVWTTAVLGLLIVLTWIPYLLNVFSIRYLLVVVFGVDAVLIYVILSVWRVPAASNLNRMALVMKGDMLVGLLAVFLGRTG
jgi:geranylgeranylglycerol-phosphate geranylgeranyltransferase